MTEIRRIQWRTYVDTDKPAATVTTTDCLTSFTILVKMHVEMILHLLLAYNVTEEPDTTLLTLTW